ncbi:hypothetical protein [Mycolicibacterium fortuitum]|uniref:hypothetical protein n=1 Tax=Mycolicibacterium fortuitum TaxID=1766 RepID=UPI0039B11D09
MTLAVVLRDARPGELGTRLRRYESLRMERTGQFAARRAPPGASTVRPSSRHELRPNSCARSWTASPSTPTTPSGSPRTRPWPPESRGPRAAPLPDA